jgi:hypothetical protein
VAVGALTGLVWFDRLGADVRPWSTSADFEHLKIVYTDLYQLNTERTHLAGAPHFPVNTDSRRLASPEAVRQLSDLMAQEVMFSMAYGPSDTPGAPHGPQETLLADSLYPGTVLRRHGSIVVENASPQRVLGVGLTTVSPVAATEVVSATASGRDRAQLAADIFGVFVSDRRNGTSPLGRSFKIGHDDFVEVYGYGQCTNQSYALADELGRHGIRASVVEIGPRSHTFVEAEVGGGRAILDPLLGVALIDTAGVATFDHEQALREPGALARHLPWRTRAAFLSYYAGAHVERVERLAAMPSTAAVARTFYLDPGERAEYLLESSYPWITTRNIERPPPGTVGSLRVTREVPLRGMETAGGWAMVTFALPYPIVDLELLDAHAAGDWDVEIAHGGAFERVSVDARYELARFARYLPRDGRQRAVSLRVRAHRGAVLPAHARFRVVAQIAVPQLTSPKNKGFMITASAPKAMHITAE